MIPLNIKIKNFLSYGSELQEIDFEPYALICLSGKNGHGKSALLDAITWALWGQARKISGTVKADETLLRIGQSHMIVIFDFLCNDHTYRIRREYLKTYGKPLVTLEFGMYDRKKDIFIPLSDKTIRSTQAKIEQTLRLDFNSFTNSAFLRQGQANEFSKKSPKERKEILGAILGLDSYESIRKLANDKVHTMQLKKSNLASLLEKIDQEINATNDVTKHITLLIQKLNALEAQEKSLYSQKEQLEHKKGIVAEEKQALRFLEFQQEQLNNEEKKERDILRALRLEWKTIHKKQINLPNYKILEKEKHKLLTIINDHQKKQQKSLELQEKRLTLQAAMQTLFSKLEKEAQSSLQELCMNVERLMLEKQNSEQRIALLTYSENEKQKAYALLRNNLVQKRSELKNISVSKEHFESSIKQFEKRKEHYQRFVMQKSLMQQELVELEQKQKLSEDDSNPSCPLCEQNLSASRRKFLKQKFVKEETFLRHRLNKLVKIIKKLKAMLIEQHKNIEMLTKDCELQKILHIKEEELIQKQKEFKYSIEELQKNKTDELKKRDHITTKLASAQIALEQNKKNSSIKLHNNATLKKHKQEIELVEKELENLTYDSKAHITAQNSLRHAEEQINRYQHDLEQIAIQGKRKQQIHELCLQLKNRRRQRNEIILKIKPYLTLESRQKMLVAKHQANQKHLDDLKDVKEGLLQEKGRLEHQQSKRIELEKEEKVYKKNIMELTNLIEDYQTIATATGKNGIQALLIQDIIPEIEQEANTLLAKLTDNQSQIFIESLRDLKKGGTKETLDIKISDSIGIRRYELFSGGEAFRIDFALRIAISKLLARRAGTALQTLIIDEGFGSQDEEGLANIMEAIYKIQDDFAKIIIVSHLSSLKDLFPVQFVVEKGARGSKITMLEQG